MQKNAIVSKTKQFRAMVTIDELEVAHGLFKEPIIGCLKSKMAEIRHLENRYDVIFFCRGWSDLDKNFGDWCRMTLMPISCHFRDL